jgi:hypothetical protein
MYQPGLWTLMPTKSSGWAIVCGSSSVNFGVLPPASVEAWQPAGVRDAWVRENGTWVGRIRLDGGRFVWIRETEVRPSEAEAV